MIIIKNRDNSIQIIHRDKTYNIHAGGRRGIQGPTGPQGPQGDPASNIVTSVNGDIGDVTINYKPFAIAMAVALG